MVDLPKLWTLQAMTLGKNGMILAKNIEVVVIACALVFLIIDHANSCDVFSSTNQCRKRKKLGSIVGGGGGICQCHRLLSEPTAGVGDGVNAKTTLTKGSPPPQAHAWSPYLPLLYCTSFYIYLSIHPKYRIKWYINCNLLHCNSLVTGFPRWFSLPSPSLHWTAHQLKRILFQVRQRVSACPNWLKDHLRWPTCPEMPCRNVRVPKVQNFLWFGFYEYPKILPGLCAGSWALQFSASSQGGKASVISGPCGAWRRAHGKVGDWKVVWRSPNAHKCLSVHCTCMCVCVNWRCKKYTDRSISIYIYTSLIYSTSSIFFICNNPNNKFHQLFEGVVYSQTGNPPSCQWV